MMTAKRLGIVLLTCSAVMWLCVFAVFFVDSLWEPFYVGAAACAISLVSIVAWAGQLTDDDRGV